MESREEITKQKEGSHENTSDNPDQIRDGSSRVGDGGITQVGGSLHPVVDVDGSLIQDSTDSSLATSLGTLAPTLRECPTKEQIDKLIAEKWPEYEMKGWPTDDRARFMAQRAGAQSLRDALLASLNESKEVVVCSTDHEWLRNNAIGKFCRDCGRPLAQK